MKHLKEAGCDHYTGQPFQQKNQSPFKLETTLHKQGNESIADV